MIGFSDWMMGWRRVEEFLLTLGPELIHDHPVRHVHER
jgi:hypothetical protein